MENKTSFKEVRNLRLDNPVVVRQVPMTDVGCSMLRAIREFQIEQLKEQEDLTVELQYPTSIHMMMQDYCKLRNIKFEK